MIVGYTTGVYDMFHVGHLRLLRRAREECDRLIVGVTTDELCLQRKKKSPIIPLVERMEIVGALDCVDQVVPQATMDKMAALRDHSFQRMFVGDDWQGTPTWVELEKRFAKHNCEIVYFPYTQHTSSTLLRETLERLRSDSEG